MGNRMFQYAFGYLLADRRNSPFFSGPLPNFNIPDTLSEKTPQPVNPIFTRTYGDNYVNAFELNTTSRDVIVNSFVQQSSYYHGYEGKLREIFNIKTSPINEGKLVLHIRETDYLNINGFLGYDYYKKLINDSKFNDVIIVTDNSECDTVKRLLSEGCTLNSAGTVTNCNHTNDDRAMSDFYTLLNSENIALSQSSFSWWAAFLGQHKKIIFPYKRNGGMWRLEPGVNDIDLYINRPSSIKYIND